MKKNKIPPYLDEVIEHLIDEISTKARATADKGEKFELAARYDCVRYLYEMYKNTSKTINTLKNTNDL